MVVTSKLSTPSSNSPVASDIRSRLLGNKPPISIYKDLIYEYVHGIIIVIQFNLIVVIACNYLMFYMYLLVSAVSIYFVVL